MMKAESNAKLMAIPGMPLLTYELTELSLVLFGTTDKLTLERNRSMKVSDTEAYFVFLEGHNIGRYVIVRQYGVVERRFLCIIPADFPVSDFPFKYLTRNIAMTVIQDRIRIIVESLRVKFLRVINKAIDLVNLMTMLPKELNQEINNTIAQGKLPENGTRLLTKLLIPSLRPDVALLADTYGDPDIEYALIPIHTDRQGRIHVNFAVAAYAPYDQQLLCWALERINYFVVQKTDDPEKARRWSTAVNISIIPIYFVRYILPPLFFILYLILLTLSLFRPIHLNWPVHMFGVICFALYLCQPIWQYFAKRTMIRVFESMGKDIIQERKSLMLEKKYGYQQPKNQAKNNTLREE